MTTWSRSRKILAATVGTALVLPVAGTSLSGVASAEASPVFGVELAQPRDQVVGLNTTYNLSVSRSEGINALKQLRGSMWDKNIWFDGERLYLSHSRPFNKTCCLGAQCG